MLKSKFRAIARSKGSANYFARLFQNCDDTGNSGKKIDFQDFVSVLRNEANITTGFCSDDDLRAIFHFIDDDHDGLADIDQIVMWFATSRTQRIKLPKLRAKVKEKARDSDLQTQQDVERATASRKRETEPTGLTAYWYKQHAAYTRQVQRGNEFRLLLPYNQPLDTVIERYEESIEKETGRKLGWFIRNVLEGSGFRISKAQLQDLLDRFRLNANETDPEEFSLDSPSIQTFFDEALIDSSVSGWE